MTTNPVTFMATRISAGINSSVKIQLALQICQNAIPAYLHHLPRTALNAIPIDVSCPRYTDETADTVAACVTLYAIKCSSATASVTPAPINIPLTAAIVGAACAPPCTGCGDYNQIICANCVSVPTAAAIAESPQYNQNLCR